MKKRFIRFLFIVIFISYIIGYAIKTDAKEIYKPNEFREARCTFYTDIGYTKDGSYTRDGICAMNDYYLGATVFVYSKEDGKVGKLLRILEVTDTGGHEELKSGDRVDIWMPSLEEGWEFISNYGDDYYVLIRFDCIE